MPYEGEFAHHRSLRRLAESERVRDLLGSYRVQTRSVETHESLPFIHLSDLSITDNFPSWVLAIDGSHAEVRVQNGYPQAEASYVTVASVLIDVAKIRELDQNRPIDPREFRKTEHAQSIDCALPSCNVILGDHRSAKESLRRTLFDVFDSHEMAPDGESLLDTFEALLAYKPSSREQRCPYDDCPLGINSTFERGYSTYPCTCPRQSPLYSTDSLRIHEGMNLEGTNGAMFAEIMQVWERIWLIHFLRALERRGGDWLSILRHLAIVLDGPLAVFGHPAWLSQAISAELYRLNKKVRASTGGYDLLLLGIEKTGAFAAHLEDIDHHGDGSINRFPSESAMLLSDDYIKRHIVFSESDKPYGQDTYFGRKFFYKAANGAKIVANIAFLTDDHRDVRRADPDQYPRLSDAMGLLNQLVSSRFPNALSPLVSAHAEAAIPLSLGGKVLEQLARKLIGKDAS